MHSNKRQFEIAFGDCDPAGIVFYPNYFRMFDAATAFLIEAALGIKKSVWTQKYGIVGIPMVDTGANFLKPARFGDVVTIDSSFTEIGKSSFKVAHSVRLDGAVAVEAHEVRVWAGHDENNPGSIKSVRIPPDVIAAFSS